MHNLLGIIFPVTDSWSVRPNRTSAHSQGFRPDNWRRLEGLHSGQDKSASSVHERIMLAVHKLSLVFCHAISIISALLTPAKHVTWEKCNNSNCWQHWHHNIQHTHSRLHTGATIIIQCVPLAGSPRKCWFTKRTKVQYICISYL
jgi:hypothetical protein